jgi:hypothetical protein
MCDRGEMVWLKLRSVSRFDVSSYHRHFYTNNDCDRASRREFTTVTTSGVCARVVPWLGHMVKAGVSPLPALVGVEICSRTLTRLVAPRFDLMAATTANVIMAFAFTKLIPSGVESSLAQDVCGDCRLGRETLLSADEALETQHALDV